MLFLPRLASVFVPCLWSSTASIGRRAPRKLWQSLTATSHSLTDSSHRASKQRCTALCKLALPSLHPTCSAPSCLRRQVMDLRIALGRSLLFLSAGAFLLFACPPTCAFVATHPNTTLNGWEAQGQYHLLNYYGSVGLVADFGGNYGSVHGSSIHQTTYLFGPQISIGHAVSPFAHALFGWATQSQGFTNSASFARAGSSDSSFAFALGAGIDFRPTQHLAYRVLQVDYVHTSVFGIGNNGARLSTGIIFRF